MSEELFKKMATSIIDGDSDAAVALADTSTRFVARDPSRIRKSTSAPVWPA